MKSQALLPMGQRQTYSVPLFHVPQQLGKHLIYLLYEWHRKKYCGRWSQRDRRRMLESLMRHGTRNIDKILQDLPACSRQDIEDFISAEKQQQVK